MFCRSTVTTVRMTGLTSARRKEMLTVFLCLAAILGTCKALISSSFFSIFSEVT
jgi:hypothetical protein